MSAFAEFKEKIEKCEVVFGSTFSSVNNIYLPRAFKGAGVDYMLFDAEHGNFNPENAVDMLQMCRAHDLPTIMRVQDCEYHCISKCLDMGADGVLIPRTETLQQVELAIASVRFYPRGRKGAGGIGLLRPGESVDEFNDNRLLFLQIESPKGVSNLDSMLTTYGVEIAGVIIGPSDLSISSGTKLNTQSDEVIRQMREITAICRRHKKSVGTNLSADKIAFWIGEGMNILWCSSDIGFMTQAARETVKMVREIYGSKND